MDTTTWTGPTTAMGLMTRTAQLPDVPDNLDRHVQLVRPVLVVRPLLVIGPVRVVVPVRKVLFVRIVGVI